MTAPNIIQQPGFGQAIQEGLAPLMQALQFRQQQAQRQEAIQAQQAQVEIQGLTQRGQERDRIVGRAISLMKLLGPDIIEDPSIQEMLEQGGINPKTVAQRFKQEQKDEDKQKKEVIAAAVASVPKEAQPGIKAFFNFINAGGGQEGATAVMKQLFAAAEELIDPDRKAALAKEFPSLFGPDAGIPFADAMEELVGIRREQAEIQARFGPGFKRRIDAENAQITRQLNQLRLQDLINKPKGAVSPSQRLTAAVSLDRILRTYIDENKSVYALRFGVAVWLDLTFEEKIDKVFVNSPAIRRAVRRIPLILAEALGEGQ